MKDQSVAELRWRACSHYWRGLRRDCPGVAQMVQRDLVEALLFRHGGGQWRLLDCYRVLSDYHHLVVAGHGWDGEINVRGIALHRALSTRRPGYILDGRGWLKRPWLPDVRNQ